MCSINCIYSPVNKGFIDEISYLRSHNRFESTSQKLIKYYTDHHDVDESIATTSIHGVHWIYDTTAGIACRYMVHTPTVAGAIVASMCRHLKYSLIIRIFMMSTKMRGLSCVNVEVTPICPWGTVSHFDLCMIILLILMIVLLLKIITHSSVVGKSV